VYQIVTSTERKLKVERVIVKGKSGFFYVTIVELIDVCNLFL